MNQNIIGKIKEANLLGRGGASFPTWLKWDAVKKQEGKKIYVIANGSEGEPAVFKDEYVLKKHPEEFIGGIKIALETFAGSEAIIYLNHSYYDTYRPLLEKYSERAKISYFRKTARYIAGDETALLSHIEGERPEPRAKPPYPAESGLYGLPTLINNIETFYRIYEIANGIYADNTYYSISGDVENKGMFELSVNLSIEEVLITTGNYPDFDFFIQYGGGAVGAIFLPYELKVPIRGAASIVVYNRTTTDLYELMAEWATFYARENCDKCTPCREGTFRILDMVKTRNLDMEKLNELFLVLDTTSFCPLGKGMSAPYKTLIEKVMCHE